MLIRPLGLPARFLIASNRIGNEEQDGYDITFYGSSFIANQFGEKVQELNETR